MEGLLRVLVVEDDATLAAVVKEVLEEEGHLATCVRSTAEAGDLVERQRWDVLLVDGFGESYADADDDVRSTLAHLSGSAPVVLTTGRAWAHASSPAELGVAAVLPKPYDLDGLVTALEQAAGAPCLSAK